MSRELEARWFIAGREEELRTSLNAAQPTLHFPRRLTRRSVFDFPDLTLNAKLAWLRLRSDDKSTQLAYKQRLSEEFGGMIESEVEVSDLSTMQEILGFLGLIEKSYQESYRERWEFPDGAHASLDEWPWLEPFLELEGPDEESVRAIASMLGLRWSEAVFGSADVMYLLQYGIDDTFETRTLLGKSRLSFGEGPPLVLRHGR